MSRNNLISPQTYILSDLLINTNTQIKHLCLCYAKGNESAVMLLPWGLLRGSFLADQLFPKEAVANRFLITS